MGISVDCLLKEGFDYAFNSLLFAHETMHLKKQGSLPLKYNE